MNLFPDDQNDNVFIFSMILIAVSIGCFAYNYTALTTSSGHLALLAGSFFHYRVRLMLEFLPMAVILIPCILFVLTLFYIRIELTISGIALFVLNVVNIILAAKAYPITLASIKLFG